MKSLHLLLAAAVVSLAPVVSASDSALARHMDEMNDAYKSFRRETDGGKGAAFAREAQEAIAKTFALLPEMVAKMPDGPAKAKAAAEYRAMTGRLYVALCEVEVAFLANDLDKVAELVETLKELKKEGHNKFMED